MERVLYLCDGEKPECKKSMCYKNGRGECRHTTDVKHAINFKKDGICFWEGEMRHGINLHGTD